MDFDKYKLNAPIPNVPTKPHPRPGSDATAQEYREYADELDKYHAEKAKADDLFKERAARQDNLNRRFKEDALKELGLDTHPKADRIYSFAWSKGHSAGIHEVWLELKELAELLEDIK